MSGSFEGYILLFSRLNNNKVCTFCYMGLAAIYANMYCMLILFISSN